MSSCNQSTPDTDSEVGAVAASDVAGVRHKTDFPRFEAFISYCHADLDMQVAKYVQRALEGFRIPRNLQAKAGRTRLGTLFRDQDELPVGGELTEEITNALQASPWLIVICSARTPESLWVSKEVETFISLHGRDRVLAVLAEGEPAEVLPAPLRTAANSASTDGSECEAEEVLAADLRPSTTPSFRRREIQRLAAALIGCGYDELVQRMRKRRVRVAAAAATVTACIALAFCGLLLHQRAIADAKQAEILASTALSALEEGDRPGAARSALDALDLSHGSPSAAVRLALSEAANAYPASYGPATGLTFSARYNLDSPYRPLAVSADWIASARSETQISVFDTSAGKPVSNIEAPDHEAYSGTVKITEPNRFLGIFAGHENTLVTLNQEGVLAFDVEDGSLAWQVMEPISRGTCKSLTLSDDGSFALVLWEPYTGTLEELGLAEAPSALTVIDAQSGTIVRTIPVGVSCPLAAPLSVDPAGRYAVIGVDNYTDGESAQLVFVDLETGGTSAQLLQKDCVNSLTAMTDHVIVSSSNITSEGRYAVDSVEFLPTSSSSAHKERAARIDTFSWNGTKHDASVELQQSGDPTACPTIRPYPLAEDLIALSCGDRLDFLSVASGSVIRSLSLDSPVACFATIGASYLVLTQNGTLYMMDRTGYTGYPAAVCSNVSSAQIVDARDGNVYVVARSLDDTSTCTVYAFSPRALAPGFSMLDSSTSCIFDKDGTKSAELTQDGTLVVRDLESNSISQAIEIAEHGIDLETAQRCSLAFSDMDADTILLLDPGTIDEAAGIWKFDISDGTLAGTWAPENPDVNVFSADAFFSPVHDGVVTVLHTNGIDLHLVDTADMHEIASISQPLVPIGDTRETPGRPRMPYMDARLVGSTILLQTNVGTVEIADLDGFSSTDAHDDHTVDSSQFNFETQYCPSPDRQAFVLADAEGTLHCIDAKTRDEIWGVDIGQDAARFVSYIGNGDRIILQDANGTCRLIDAHDGSTLSSMDLETASIRSVQVRDDTVYAAAAGVARTNPSSAVYALDIAGDQLETTAIIPDCVLVNASATHAIGRDYLCVYSVPLFSTEELRAMAKETAGYESSATS